MSVPEKFVCLLEEARVFYRNLNKDSLERRKSKKYINSKVNKLNKIRSELGSYRENFNLGQHDPKTIAIVRECVKEIEKVLKLSQNTLDSRLLALEEVDESGANQTDSSGSESEIFFLSEQVNLPKPEKMGEKFDLKTASSLLPVMNGSELITKQLVDSIEWYDALLDQAGKKLLTTYVLKTRLSEGAKLRLKSAYASNDILIQDIRANFISKKSPAVLSVKLNSAKQRGKSVEEFGKSIEEMLVDLTISQANGDAGTAEILRPVNEQIAINSFANGLQSNDLRTIIKSRNFQSLSEAIRGAMNEELTHDTPKPFFHMRGNNKFFRRQANFGGQFRHRGAPPQRFSPRGSYNYRGNAGSGQFRGNFNAQGCNSNQSSHSRGNFNAGRNFSRNSESRGRNYFLNSGERPHLNNTQNRDTPADTFFRA